MTLCGVHDLSQDKGDGSYEGELRVTVSGDYSLLINIDKEPIQQLPVTRTVVPAAMHGPTCSANGQGLISTAATDEGLFTIKSKDEFGASCGDAMRGVARRGVAWRGVAWRGVASRVCCHR